MGIPFKTGRPIPRLRFSGAIVGSSQTIGGGPMGTAAADTASQGQIVCGGTTLTFHAYSKYDYGAVSNLQVTLSAPDGYSDAQLVHVGDESRFSTSIDASGSWEVEFDVEEWANVYVPAASATVNGSSFPTFGGAAQGDGLPAMGIQYFLLLKVGGTYSCSITSGSVTLSHAFTIASAGSVGFLINPTVTTSASGGDSNTTSVGVQYMGTPISTTYHEVGTSAYGTMTVDATGGSVSAEVASQGQCQIEAFVNPPIVMNLSGRLRSWGQMYPGSAKVTWTNLAGSTATLTPSMGGFADSVTQNEWSCSGYYESDLIGTHTPYPTVSVEQWQAASIWLTNLGLLGSGDDTHDWRMQFSGFSWPAVSLSRATSLLLDPCSSLAQWSAGANTSLSLSGGVTASVSGGGGSLNLAVPHAKRVWEGYRYLAIACSFDAFIYNNTTSYAVGDCCSSGGLVYQAIAATTGNAPPNATFWSVPDLLPVTVGAGSSWVLNVPLASGVVRLDLCCGTNDLATIGVVQSRFPIAYPGGFPINQDPIDAYDFGWGVNYSDSVGFGGIPNGCIVTISDVSLVSAAGGDAQSAVTLLENFLNFVQGWTSPTDNTTVQPFLFLEADGRVIDIPALCLVTPTTGSTGPTYTWYTLAQLVEILEYFPGLTASALPDPTDTYHGSGLFGLLLGGSGATYDWTLREWTDWVDVGLPQTAMPAQDLWDEVQLYPGCGEVFSQSGTFGVPAPLRVSKSLRGQCVGLIFDTSGVAASGVQVKAYQTAVTTNSEGDGTSNTLGAYLTGTPWLDGNVDSTADLNLAPIPHMTHHGVVQNRQRFRTSFRHARPTTKSLGYDVSGTLRHVRTYASSGSGDIGMRTAGNVLPQTWSDTDTGLAGSWARPRFQDHGLGWPIGLFFGDGSTCTFAQTYDEGSTWINSTSMGAGLVGDFEEGANGLRWFFKVQDDGGAYNVYGRILDAQLNVVRDWTLTSVTGIDNAPLACRESSVADGSWRIGLYYTVGGVETVKFSQDGLAFV